MAMRRSHNLHTIYQAEVIEHSFPPEMGVDLTIVAQKAISYPEPAIFRGRIESSGIIHESG